MTGGDPAPGRAAVERRTAAMCVIGDELLAGKAADSNTRDLARLLRRKGIALRRVVVIPDDPDAIAMEVRWLAAGHDLVFTSGGVGATHDDVTMEGIARAFGTGVVHHPDFLAVLRAGGLETTHRDLARVPAGAGLRGGGDARWPVVVMANVWILPGLPPAFQRKLAVVADCLDDGPAFHATETRVAEPEEALIPLLNELVARHPAVRFGSYPEATAVRITVDGDDESAVRAAAAALRAGTARYRNASGGAS